MKRLAAIAVKVFTLGIPMVIAACYGMPARYSLMGTVIDADTQDPLSDIKVSCIDRGGAVTDSTTSYEGDWTLYYDELCDQLAAEDTKSPARYQQLTVPFDGKDTTLRMTQVQ